MAQYDDEKLKGIIKEIKNTCTSNEVDEEVQRNINNVEDFRIFRRSCKFCYSIL